MKIISLLNKGTEVNFSNELVKFNEKGEAKVDEKLGKKIIKNFPKTVWEEGKEPVVEVKEKEGNVNDPVETQSLKDEIVRLKIIIKDKDDALTKAKKQEQIWRDSFQELEKKIKDKEVSSEEEIKTDNGDEIVVPKGYEEMYAQMKTKNFPVLKKWIKDELKKTEDDLKGIKTRDGLINYVFNNL
jgi:hypothetical protein